MCAAKLSLILNRTVATLKTNNICLYLYVSTENDGIHMVWARA